MLRPLLKDMGVSTLGPGRLVAGLRALYEPPGGGAAGGAAPAVVAWEGHREHLAYICEHAKHLEDEGLEGFPVLALAGSGAPGEGPPGGAAGAAGTGGMAEGEGQSGAALGATSAPAAGGEAGAEVERPWYAPAADLRFLDQELEPMRAELLAAGLRFAHPKVRLAGGKAPGWRCAEPITTLPFPGFWSFMACVARVGAAMAP
jgi:hypothetical protein